MADPFGPLLKRWRQTRRMSQETLALDAEISTRHLSCLETGKAKPSRDMVLLLSSALELDLRERNVMLGSAGFAPMYTSSGLDSLSMAPIRKAVGLLMAQQEPYGALLVDRVWNVLQMNGGALRMMRRFMPVAPEDPKIASNVLRATMHPTGLRPAIVNWVEVAVLLLERMDHECAMYPHDEERLALRDEVRGYPGVAALELPQVPAPAAPVSLVHMKLGEHEARLFTMVTTIGTPLDVTAQELAIESYFPADEATDEWLKQLD
ncbi:MAG: helix-turn-helix transcriptional regulator [Myxococcaceae bacterium]|nr:helix-turn-helix transcriptional regulator [Myxococcaceae bacterium]